MFMREHSDSPMITAIDPANLQDEVRAEKARIDKKEGGLVIASMNSTLGASFSKIIERLWLDTAEKRADFKLNLESGANVADEIHIQCLAFLRKEMIDAYAAALKDPELRIMHEQAKVLLDLSGANGGVDRAIVGNLDLGVMTTVGIAEMACQLVDWSMARNSEKKAAEELMREILGGKKLLGLIASVAFTSKYVGTAFMNTVEEKSVFMRNGEKRSEIRPDLFQLIVEDGVSFVKARPETMAMVKQRYNNAVKADPTNGICPAALAKTGESVVISEFVRWILKVMKENYVSHYYDEKDIDDYLAIEKVQKDFREI